MSALAPRRLKRYGEIARLFIKYGRPELVSALRARGLEVPDRHDAAPAAPQEQPEQLARDLEEMGPTFVKLGQLLSSRADLLPPAYIDSLARLQDEVEPFSFSEVERVLSEELGVRRSRAFSEFEPAPLAIGDIPSIARKKLIAAVARKHDRHVIARQL